MRISKHFMKSAEFKARQMWLEFECAAGMALETISESIESGRKWFKSWVKGFKSKVRIIETEQLILNFEKMNE